MDLSYVLPCNVCLGGRGGYVCMLVLALYKETFIFALTGILVDIYLYALCTSGGLKM